MSHCESSGTAMNRTYTYKGFEVVVNLEAQWESSGNVTLLPATGFLAVVSIRRPGERRATVAPIRLAANNQRPFATESDALMAGFSAGQRLVDDALIL